MPRFSPFPGIRYDTERVPIADVIAPPYDVVDADEQQRLESRSTFNSIRVELARADGDPYLAARERFDTWLSEGVLRQDRPSLYGYEMTGVDDLGVARRVVGVFGALDLAAGDVLPHEHTTPKAKSDRLDLLRATTTNTSPIWVLTPASIASLVDTTKTPDADVTDDDSVRHRLWVLDDDAASAVTDAVTAAPVVVADGHHRYETAKTYRDEVRSQHADAPGDHDAVLALVVELAPENLAVAAIHRLLLGIGGDAALDLLRPHFDLVALDSAEGIGAAMEQSGSLGVLTASGAWLAKPTAATEDASAMDLDSSRLDVALRDLPADASVVFQHGWRECADAVAKGDAGAAVLLRPATVEQIAAVGRGGDRMPPKTTFFWPKPRTGMVFRRLAPPA
ncbi:MAG TPA: DUF1015 domain-containing protein [Acidimicrobiales bacterium]|nr:DUF1015 domain-containing protein [Acidimicrobiales bacterium]